MVYSGGGGGCLIIFLALQSTPQYQQQSIESSIKGECSFGGGGLDPSVIFPYKP